jgi:spoIIIJ-associated protein
MEWVETTGRSVEEAKELALDQLGVHEEDAEFDVVEEPRPGLFGRMRGEARVRARVRPAAPRPKADRRERRRKPRDPETTGGEAADAPGGAPAAGEIESTEASPAANAPAEPNAPKSGEPATAPNGAEPATAAVPTAGDNGGTSGEAEREAAAAFLRGLAEALGEQARVEVVVLAEDEAEVRVEGGDLGILIGPRGQTLLAVQDLTRLAAQRRAGERHGRLRIDIAGYRERRKEALARFTAQVAAEVISSRSAKALEPMSSMDRKIVHDAVNQLEGVETVSEGEEPFRRVVIRPAAHA